MDKNITKAKSGVTELLRSVRYGQMNGYFILMEAGFSQIRPPSKKASK